MYSLRNPIKRIPDSLLDAETKQCEHIMRQMEKDLSPLWEASVLTSSFALYLKGLQPCHLPSLESLQFHCLF